MSYDQASTENRWDILSPSVIPLSANPPNTSGELVRSDPYSLDTIDAPENTLLPAVYESGKVPSHENWKILGEVVLKNTKSATYISTDPVFIKLTEKLQRKDEVRTEKKQRHGSLRRAIATVGGMLGGMFAGAAAGGTVGYVESGGSFDWSVIGGVYGMIPGAMTALGIYGYRQGYDGRADKAMAKAFTTSEQSWVIPNHGTLSKSLGKTVSAILTAEKAPAELLKSKLLPLVKSIMKAEIELPGVNNRLAEIDSYAEDGVLNEDLQASQLALNEEKKRLVDLAAEMHERLEVIRGAQLKHEIISASPDDLQ